MTDTLAYVLDRFHPQSVASPVEIPNIGRQGLASLFSELGFTKGAEIGVEQGEYSEELCKANPKLHLYAVDAWLAYGGYRDHVDQKKLNRFYAATQERLTPYHATVMRSFSVPAAKDFQDGELDFVYLDANHRFESLTADLAAWSPKVREGGIIAGHDYVRYKLPNLMHVVQVVHGWTNAYEIAPWFVLGTNAQVKGEIRDTSRSWFWVHEPLKKHMKQRKIKQ